MKATKKRDRKSHPRKAIGRRKASSVREVAADSRQPTSTAAVPGTPSVANGGPSMMRIFEGTLAAISRHGARQLSMTDVCHASGISRATLYRYFATKEDLLAAVGEYISSNFVAGVKATAVAQPAPAEKLRAVLQFMVKYTKSVKSERILEIESSFIMKFLQRNFSRHLAALSEALEPVFDAIEARLGIPLDRVLICELLLRSQESTSLIPAGASWDSMPDLLAKLAQLCLEAPPRVAKARTARSA